MTDRTVYIHTNAKQRLGALVGQHALRRHSRHPERFDVRILVAEDFPFLAAHEGRGYLREGKIAHWRNDDLQSFVPLRFAVPAQQGYRGRAVVMDPDIFAVGDINQLLDHDMGGHAILARRMGSDSFRASQYASSVMLLECPRLTHWKVEQDFEALFEQRVDYRHWMWLGQEPEGSVGELSPNWNDFDHLGPETRLLHNTHRRTQPWKTGLPADFTTRGVTFGKRVGAALRRAKATLTGASANGYYQPHPDPAQERLFFQLLSECLADGTVTRDLLQEEIGRQHIRTDAFEKVREAARAPRVVAMAA